MRLRAYILTGLIGFGALAAVLMGEPATVETSPALPQPSSQVDVPQCPKPGPRTYAGTDVQEFDISGLKLEMAADEVQEIMNCARVTERSITLKECSADIIEYERQWRDARKRGGVNTKAVERNCTASIAWREQGRRVTVNFVEDVPANPGRMVAYQISTEQDGAINEASLKTFREALIEKYGKPTTDSRTDLVWGSYPAPQLRFFPYAQFYLDLVHRGLKTKRDQVMLKFVNDAAPTVEPRL